MKSGKNCGVVNNYVSIADDPLDFSNYVINCMT